MTTAARDPLRDLEDSIDLVSGSAGEDEPDLAGVLLDRLGGVRIQRARREALTRLQASRSNRSPDLLRVLDVLDEALDRLDAGRT